MVQEAIVGLAPFLMVVVLHLVWNMLWTAELIASLVVQRLNEVCDAIGDLATLVWGQVQREPIVCES